VVALALALAGLLLAGCGVVRAFVSTQYALEDAGYRNVAIGVDTDGDVLEVTWRPRATSAEALHDEALGGARIVWDVTPFWIGGVRMIGNGGLSDAPGSEFFGREELAAAFGPRPPGRDDTSFADLANVKGLLAGFLAVVVGAIGVAVLIVVLVVRGGRKRRAEQWAPQGYWPPHGSWPPGSWPPGSWPPGPPQGPTPDDPYRSAGTPVPPTRP
jgi:hypothetical protein